jgi:hypothetical protein
MAGMERYAIYSDNCQSLLNRRIEGDCRRGEVVRSSQDGSQERLPSKPFEGDDGKYSSEERCNPIYRFSQV